MVHYDPEAALSLARDRIAQNCGIFRQMGPSAALDRRAYRVAKEAPSHSSKAQSSSKSSRIDGRFCGADPFLKKHSRGLGCSSEKVIISLCGLNTSAWEPATASGKEKNHLRIGYIGQMTQHKGIHILIKALNRLNNSNLVPELKIYGDRNQFPHYSAKLLKLVATLESHFKLSLIRLLFYRDQKGCLSKRIRIFRLQSQRGLGVSQETQKIFQSVQIIFLCFRAKEQQILFYLPEVALPGEKNGPGFLRKI